MKQETGNMYKEYIVIDIESVPNSVIPDWGREYVNKRIEKKRGENKDFNRYCSLHCAPFAQIICIGIGINGSDFFILKGNEHDILQQFWDIIKEHAGIRVVGFNSKLYDIPFINSRSCILQVENYGIDIPTRKYEKNHHYDCLEVLSNFGAGEMHSLKVYCMMYGIPYKNNHDGSDIYAMYLNGDIESIYTKCLNDIKATNALYNKIITYI